MTIGQLLWEYKSCLKVFLIDKTLFKLYFENHSTKQTDNKDTDAKNIFIPLVNFKHVAKHVTWILNRAVNNRKKLEWKMRPVKKSPILPCLNRWMQNTILIEIISVKTKVIHGILHVFSKFIWLIWIKV